jgi:diacylglycerol kinase family enzyme
MRALLVCNPKATTTSDRVRDVLVRALRSETQLDVAYTRRRGHAAALARDARHDGMDLVVALGGDGTVNEIVNGLLRDGTGDGVPSVAVVPGGSTNVFVRALGLPTDWAEGTAVILEALRDQRSRAVGLGRADDRYFTFCAGFGMDADVIHRVERSRLRGRKSSPMLYMQSVASNFLFDRQTREERITIERPAEEPTEQLSTVIIQNTAPWTFIGDRRIDAAPDASFDLGLDIMAMRHMSVAGTTRTMAQLLLGRRDKETTEPVGPHGKQVVHFHDLSEFTLSATSPVGLQVDGDFIGERSKVRFTSVPAAIQVVC